MFYNFVVLIDNSQRVDMYLSTLFTDFSRSYIQKMIDRGQVKLNGKEINKNIKVKKGDELYLEIKNENLEIEAENIPLDIIYEDDGLLIINKDPFINVHPVPGENGNKNTLVNAVLNHCKTNLPSIGGIHRPGIIHRLDKNTSGIIMIAKSDKMMNYLGEVIKNRKIEKTYIAIVYGLVKEKEFKIESHIGRDQNNRIKMTTINPINPKIAISYGKVIGYIEDKYTLLEVKIETGRTHQIRVHLSSIGYPIIGDTVYGIKKVNEEIKERYGLDRQALHAYKLKFILYLEEKEFKGNLKNDIKKVIGNGFNL